MKKIGELTGAARDPSLSSNSARSKIVDDDDNTNNAEEISFLGG